MTRILFCSEGKAFTFLEDAASPSDLVKAINSGRCRLAFPPGNGPWWATRQGDLVIVTAGVPPMVEEVPHLSPRLRQVLLFLVEGLATKEIALRLELSPRTVNHYVVELQHLLQARTSHQLVGRAVALGLCRPSLPE